MAEYNMGPFKPNPKGLFKPNTKYKYFDMVEYEGGSYLNINNDTVDGTSSIGVPPTGEPQSELYWMCLCKPGRDGVAAKEYTDFATIEDDGIWDYNITDKVIIPKKIGELKIKGSYSGCMGMVLSKNANDFKLPPNSMTDISFNYIKKSTDSQIFVSTFTCLRTEGELIYIWNRSLIEIHEISTPENIIPDEPEENNPPRDDNTNRGELQ